MRLAITALTAALLLGGTASRAQDAAGTTDNQATAAKPGSAAVKPTVRPTEPKPRRDLLFDVINVLTRPRPAAPAGIAAPPSVEPAAAPAATTPVPAEPRGAAGAPLPPAVVVPREVNAPTATPVAPRPGPTVTPPPPAPPVSETAGAPIPAEDVQPASSPDLEVLDPAAVPRPTPAPAPAAISEPASPGLGAPGWLLLGLLAAAAIAATSVRVQRTRRIARTRAALALEPRLDLSAGTISLSGLALAGPPLAIRARLDPPQVAQ